MQRAVPKSPSELYVFDDEFNLLFDKNRAIIMKLKITRAQARLLEAVRRKPRATASELGEFLCLTESTIENHFQAIYEIIGFEKNRGYKRAHAVRLWEEVVYGSRSQEEGEYELVPAERAHVPDILRIDAEAYVNDARITAEKATTWLDRFPQAFLVLLDTERRVPVAYISSFPISLEASQAIVNRPVAESWHLPGTSSEPEAFMPMSVAEVRVSQGYAWYIDSIARQSSVPPEAFLALQHKYDSRFRQWANGAQKIVTITVSSKGEKAIPIGNMLFGRYGFGEFLNMWELPPEEGREYRWRCWVARKDI